MQSIFRCGLLVSLASASVTHQNPAITGPDVLSRWLDMRSPENDTTSNLMSRSLSPEQLFGKRASEPPGEGALLCPNGECADKSCCSVDGVCGYGKGFCDTGCQSNCDATAMCGELSEGGDIPCGLNLCCSSGGWCGTTETHCVGPNKWSLCQQGYGSCSMIKPKTCGKGSGTADKRMIGYYQANNMRNRACNKVYPKDIKTDSYTHLYWAFATIDPSSYAVKLSDSEDEDNVRDFTALKGKGRNLQTWVAVGGYDFSDEDKPTHKTWAKLCADAGHRAAFIKSAAAFMDKYGFQGIDLDWEYPGEPKRGGSRADIANFVLLLKDMKTAWGNKYGISLTLAPDYWYLRYFDVAGLEPYVDHFGFMAYDLHGFWDADVKTLDPIIRGQADIREIANNTIPLAYAGVDFNKIVFGVAWYGRGYTVTNPSCNTLGCPFSGPSNPAKCTNSAGVMSLLEIQDKVKNGAKTRLLKDSAMKELVFDNQWIGYDDRETIELKREFANNYCFGGLMAWSVDFEPGTASNSGDLEPEKSKDGKCGPKNKGAICEGTSYGDCCSEYGSCGSSELHCGTGCVSGKCVKNGKSTNGRCGAGFLGATCKGTSYGDCCSAGGWCGSSDGHCGDGCQNGACKNGGGGDGDTTIIDLKNKGTQAGKTGDNGADWPQDLKDDICKYKFDQEEASEVSLTWFSSGAAYWFREWLFKNGAEKWTDKFFKDVIAGGKQGSSTFDCKDLGSTTCTGPGTTPCTTYTPPMAFYVHVQIANMFSAFHKIWAKSVNFSIQQLSSGIKDIVKEYGDPPADDRGMILNMLVGILTAGAGVGAASPGIAGTLTFFSGAFASASANSGSFSPKVTADDLENDLENAYGTVFSAVLNATNGYVEDVLSGKLPSNMQGGGLTAEDWVFTRFAMGAWLSEPLITKAMNAYVEATHKKWLEFAKTRALMTGHNGRYYSLMASRPDTVCDLQRTQASDPVGKTQKMTKDVCTNKLSGCIWHDDKCVCFGITRRVVQNPKNKYTVLTSVEVDAMKKVVDDYDAALVNNYECNNGKPSVPTQKDLSVTKPIQYPKCFIAFPTLSSKEEFGCSIPKDKW
ncbi:glycoside hydrolase family 18 [Fusarium subglutinans]|uniref:chitinase n=1 Tax=Gibberella subglutinans TaxID=42677 RepID=A0A8H5NS35_GIBSU|nr:glycoside hydrolase family 18 [Fusarium subglutinans]KAF5574913.1 glycoside hydrolase family 18 [Fusarium subglutinans]